MYSILIFVDAGCEEAAAQEAATLLEKKTTISQHIVRISGSLLDACTLTYHMKTAKRVLIELLDPCKSIDELRTKKVPDELFPEACTFKAAGTVLSHTLEGERTSHPMKQELVEAVGAVVHTTTNRAVDLENPNVTVFGISTAEQIYVGVDMGGDLAKREWRIMLSSRSLKATTAAAAAVYSGVQHDEVILDPFSDDGTIAIETALLLSQTSAVKFEKRFPFQELAPLQGTDWNAWRKEQDKERSISKISVFSDDLKEVKAVRMNSKLAGVEKLLHSTKVAVDWLDMKIKENSIQRIITYPPQTGRTMSEKRVSQILSNMFDQANHVLVKEGTVTCITSKAEEVLSAAEEQQFTIVSNRNILMGKLPMNIITFTR